MPQSCGNELDQNPLNAAIWRRSRVQTIASRSIWGVYMHVEMFIKPELENVSTVRFMREVSQWCQKTEYTGHPQAKTRPVNLTFNPWGFYLANTKHHLERWRIQKIHIRIHQKEIGTEFLEERKIRKLLKMFLYMYICIQPRENCNTNFSYRVIICNNLQWYFKKTPCVRSLPLVFKMSYLIPVSLMLLNLLWESSFSCPNKYRNICSSDKAQSRDSVFLYFCGRIMVSVSWAAEPPVNHNRPLILCFVALLPFR